MEAKDTVNPYRTNEFCVNWQDNLITTSMGDAYEVGKRVGIREVVEWIRRANHSGDFYYSFDQAELQAKLKEWGIKE